MVSDADKVLEKSKHDFISSIMSRNPIIMTIKYDLNGIFVKKILIFNRNEVEIQNFRNNSVWMKLNVW